MKTVTISSTKKITYTGDVMAIFSQQPLVIESSMRRKTSVTVSSVDLDGRSITEERYPKDSLFDVYQSWYDISRMAQLCCSMDNFLQRVKYDGTPYPTTKRLSIICREWDGVQWVVLNSTPIYVYAMFAACDALEAIDNALVRRRIWVNYPSTIQCTQQDNFIEVGASQDIYVPVVQANSAAFELDWLKVLEDNEDSEYDTVKRGVSVTDTVTYTVAIREGQGAIELVPTYKQYKFIPDTTPFGRGVYLRWLNRDGSIGYWLFTKSKEVTAASVDKSYSQYVEGSLAIPQDGIYGNSSRVDYNMTESWTIGTKWVEEDDFALLKGLTVSPMVEMLVGGTRTSPVWQRVVVAAGTYTKETPKSGLRRLRDFEVVITLPDKNTVKL